MHIFKASSAPKYTKMATLAGVHTHAHLRTLKVCSREETIHGGNYTGKYGMHNFCLMNNDKGDFYTDLSIVIWLATSQPN